ncbi:MAG: ankyrin repeat domain-containing protein [Cyanobacteria bacterium J06626_14]
MAAISSIPAAGIPCCCEPVSIRLYGERLTFLFLQAGVNINATNNDGDTPLHIAIRHHRLNVAQFLIERGARINERNYEGHIPLNMVLSQEWRDDTVELLFS